MDLVIVEFEHFADLLHFINRKQYTAQQLVLNQRCEFFKTNS